MSFVRPSIAHIAVGNLRRFPEQHHQKVTATATSRTLWLLGLMIVFP
jgi:hypothetical protein